MTATARNGILGLPEGIIVAYPADTPNEELSNQIAAKLFLLLEPDTSLGTIMRTRHEPYGFAEEIARQIICLDDLITFPLFFDLPYTSRHLQEAQDQLAELTRAHMAFNVTLSAGRRIDPQRTLAALITEAMQRTYRLQTHPFITNMRDIHRQCFSAAFNNTHHALQLAYSRCRPIGALA